MTRILVLGLTLAMASAASVRRPPPMASVRPRMALSAFDEMKAAAEKLASDTEKKAKLAAGEARGVVAEPIVAQKVAAKLEKAQEKYDIPDKWAAVMKGFFTSYMTNVYKAGNDVDYYETVLTELFKKVLECVAEPYQFEPYHAALREPYDFYALAQNFSEGVINREDSEVFGLELVKKMQEQMAAGDNVVLLANHQSEADPQIFSTLLDPIAPGFAESAIFVAGDRVTTDLLAQPFSKGRNLLCIYSKKHIENPPELKAEKSRHNKNVMKQMKNLFAEGGKLIWVAPSGGRDRADASGEYQVAPFDPKSVEMFRLMAGKARERTTHFYPLSMLTWPVCPPPQAVGGAVGEVRVVGWRPAGLHFGPSIDFANFDEGCVASDLIPEGCDPADEKEAMQRAAAEHVHGVVSKNYKGLEETMRVWL